MVASRQRLHQSSECHQIGGEEVRARNEVRGRARDADCQVTGGESRAVVGTVGCESHHIAAGASRPNAVDSVPVGREANAGSLSELCRGAMIGAGENFEPDAKAPTLMAQVDDSGRDPRSDCKHPEDVPTAIGPDHEELVIQVTASDQAGNRVGRGGLAETIAVAIHDACGPSLVERAASGRPARDAA
jgi:hypothetical protein